MANQHQDATVMSPEIQILFTDLDGTLLNSFMAISTDDLACLEELGRQHIIRVIATGRSLFSYTNLFKGYFPADYLIFSTGAGILDLHSGTLLHSSSFDHVDITRITTHLMAHGADFMVHRVVPDNHHFTYCGNRNRNDDFARRLDIYSGYSADYAKSLEFPRESAQIIAIFPENLKRFHEVRQGLTDCQVVRTTSPLDHSSIWMEIYPRGVSKGMAASWMCDYLGINHHNTFGLGNDYNDISLLDFTQVSYVVANAPDELKARYQTTCSNNNSGLSAAVREALQIW